MSNKLINTIDSLAKCLDTARARLHDDAHLNAKLLGCVTELNASCDTVQRRLNETRHELVTLSEHVNDALTDIRTHVAATLSRKRRSTCDTSESDSDDTSSSESDDSTSSSETDDETSTESDYDIAKRFKPTPISTLPCLDELRLASLSDLNEAYRRYVLLPIVFSWRTNNGVASASFASKLFRYATYTFTIYKPLQTLAHSKPSCCELCGTLTYDVLWPDKWYVRDQSFHGHYVSADCVNKFNVILEADHAMSLWMCASETHTSANFIGFPQDLIDVDARVRLLEVLV